MEYYKITNESETKDNFHYKDGLNVIKKKFKPNLDVYYNEILYYTTAGYIYEHIEHYKHGYWLRCITLPTENPLFKMVKNGNHFRANMINFGKKI